METVDCGLWTVVSRKLWKSKLAYAPGNSNHKGPAARRAREVRQCDTLPRLSVGTIR